MLYDAHIHMVLDGRDWKAAMAAHRPKPDEALIRRQLQAYRTVGIRWLRDGGDALGAGALAAQLAPEYGIEYRTPVFPIYQRGHYGSFIGRGFETLDQYRQLLQQVRRQGGDFVKLMISGLMDFNHFGAISEPSLTPQRIQTLVGLAHDAGFSVMVHCNGPQAILAAVAAGVDSLEHGAYIDEEAALALAQSQTIWVPTLSTIGNLIGGGRHSDTVLQQILDYQTQMVRLVWQHGGHIALGSDAGAHRVLHVQAVRDEWNLLSAAIEPAELQPHLNRSGELLRRWFRRH